MVKTNQRPSFEDGKSKSWVFYANETIPALFQAAIGLFLARMSRAS